LEDAARPHRTGEQEEQLSLGRRYADRRQTVRGAALEGAIEDLVVSDERRRDVVVDRCPDVMRHVQAAKGAGTGDKGRTTAQRLRFTCRHAARRSLRGA